MMRFASLVLACLLPRASGVYATVRGRQLLVGGEPLHLKGINWNPVPLGGRVPVGVEFRRAVDGDSRLMRQLGVNVLRTYEGLVDVGVLDALWAQGIQVINTVYSTASNSLERVAAQVDAVKDHPAILMWSVGNEWNYNKLYSTSLSFDACVERVAQVVRLIKQHDPNHPVATVYGEVPTPDVLARLRDVDVWGINYYDGASFGDLFDRWAGRSGAPMFLGEYGADAYDALAGREDEAAQALATAALTREIVGRSTLVGGVCLGGLIFELSDEWWKDAHGSPNMQDVGGIAPGGGPYPDRVFNEEWWGLVRMDRSPRQAFAAFAGVAPPVPGPAAWALRGAALMPGAASGKAAAPLPVELSAVRAARNGPRLSCTSAGCTEVRPAAGTQAAHDQAASAQVDQAAAAKAAPAAQVVQAAQAAQAAQGALARQEAAPTPRPAEAHRRLRRRGIA